MISNLAKGRWPAGKLLLWLLALAVLCFLARLLYPEVWRERRAPAIPEAPEAR
ncbi:MAG: hypothetical protein AB7N76_03940 [Planctomycetota bacterium]